MNDRVTKKALWNLDVVSGRFTRTGDLRVLMGIDGYDHLTLETLSSKVHPEDVDAFHCLFGPFEEGDFVKACALRVFWEDGSLHTIRFLVARDRGEGSHALSGLAEDADDVSKAYETRILRSQLDGMVRERDLVVSETQKLMYHLSHDLQAPIRNVIGFSQAVIERHSQGLDAKGRDYLQRVAHESGRMNQMISGLLQMSRLGTCPLNIQPLDLSEMVRSRSQILLEKYQRPMEFHVQDEVSLDGDAHMMDILLGELLDNACKFSMPRSNPCISFGARDGPDCSTIYLRDNGVGFDPSYSAKLFTPFQRLHTEREFPGIGMGLAIVSIIVNRHGGRVWCESNSGDGATFVFTIPNRV
jgi:light-regulated signal transduction histidine kinase (bacteriophytochrome)